MKAVRGVEERYIMDPSRRAQIPSQLVSSNTRRVGTIQKNEPVSSLYPYLPICIGSISTNIIRSGGQVFDVYELRQRNFLQNITNITVNFYDPFSNGQKQTENYLHLFNLLMVLNISFGHLNSYLIFSNILLIRDEKEGEWGTENSPSPGGKYISNRPCLSIINILFDTY